MKKSILILFAIIFSMPVLAQTQETIHLNNGTVVSGSIVEYVPNKTYTIMTADGNKFVFEVKDIAKITYGTLTKTTNANPAKRKDLFAPGYQGYAASGSGVGMGTYGLDMFKVDFVNGHRFNENLFVGGGIGLRQPVESNWPAFIPIYANGRYNLSPVKSVVPFASLSAGVAFNSDEGLNEGGLMVNPAIGVYLNKFSSILVNLSIGYDVMDVPFYEVKALPYFPYTAISRRIRSTESFVFNVGITF